MAQGDKNVNKTAKLNRSVVGKLHTVPARFAATDTDDGTVYLRVDGRYEFSGGNTQESYGLAVLVDENSQPVRAATMALLIRYTDGYEVRSPILEKYSDDPVR